MMSPKGWLMALAVGVVVLVLGSPVQAQTASALLREKDELPGAPGAVKFAKGTLTWEPPELHREIAG